MRKIVLAAVLVLMASGVQAVTLTVVGGQLMGASNVLVDGSLYDVQFLDGTCADFYSGCDEASDFTFQAVASAALASQALLDQVFLDGPSGLFDTDPNLINGCGPNLPSYCSALTPYAFTTAPLWTHSLGDVLLVVAANFSPPPITFLPAGPSIYDDRLLNSHAHVPPGFTLAGTSSLTYAQWSTSPIPEPSTALLLGLGLTGLAAKGRRRNRS